MNKRLYLLAGAVSLLTILSIGTVVYLQGDFYPLTRQTSIPTSKTIQIELSENGAKSSSEDVQIAEMQSSSQRLVNMTSVVKHPI